MSYGEDEQISWQDQVTPPGEPDPDTRSMLGRNPGWYPDPLSSRHQRWWTGHVWSEHTDPPAGPALPMPTERVLTPGRNRQVIARVAAILAATLILMLGLVAAGVLAQHRAEPATAPVPPVSSAVPAPTPSGPAAFAVLGIPANATLTCPQGLELTGPGSQVTCTYKSATTLGTVTCERSDSATVCAVHDEVTDQQRQTVCTSTGTVLECAPKTRLGIPTG